MNEKEVLRLFDISELQQKNRELLVVKSNEVIQTVKRTKLGAFSLQQFKLLSYTLGRIKQDFKGYKERGYIALTYREFCEAAGIDITSDRGIYKRLKESLRGLLEKGQFIKTPDGGEPWMRWLDQADLSPIDLPKGYFKLTIGAAILPYLIDVKNGNFTAFETGWVMRFNSKYTPRLYEEFRSRLHRTAAGTWTIEYSMDRLREILFLGENTTYAKNATFFRERVLERSVDEINEYSDLKMEIKYKSISGKRITSVEFSVRNKDENELIETRERNNRELDKSAGIAEVY